ncbi:unnamed protein product, partial [Lymnaea stagnalis]
MEIASQPIVSDGVLQSFQICLGITELVAGVLGVAFNIINMIVFFRLGLSDSTNISLAGLALADIGVSLTMLCYGALNNPLVFRTVSALDAVDAVRYIVLGISHILFSRIAGLLTAFISLERFLCVTWPLHVKSIVTTQRTIFVVLSVYVFMVSGNIPTWLVNRIGQRLNQRLNVTTVGLISSPNAEELENITIVINVTVQMTSFAIVVVSTACMINSLRKVAEWKKSSNLFTGHTSSRDKQLVRMVVLISAVFIVCSFPSVLVNGVMPFFKEFKIKGREKNLFIVTTGFCFMSQLVNAIVNICIYFSMSSRFRRTCLVMFKFK